MHDYYEIIDPESGEYEASPVKLDEVKLYCRISNIIENDLLLSMIKSATVSLESYCNRVFIQKDFKGYFSELQQSSSEMYPYIILKRSPLVEVDSVEIMLDDVETELDSDYYQVKQCKGYSKILFLESFSVDDVPYPIRVNFSAGYGSHNDVPDDIKTAIKQYVSFIYENRGDVEPTSKGMIPSQIKGMLAFRRILNTCV